MKKLFSVFLNIIPRPWLIKGSFLVRPVIAWWYRGNRYTDPIDGKSFKSFLPYGYESIRENVLSPSTLSLERHRLLWLYLNAETQLFKKPIKLLHVAPEQCFYGRFRQSELIDYTTTDLLSPLADVKADICDLPFENDSYDMILCNHVLEHIPDDRKAMSELYRVLKPGGMAILQVPMENDRVETFEDDSITDREERAKIFGQYDHVRIYGLDYIDRLREVGFTAHLVPYTDQFTAAQIDRYRLAKGERIPMVQKS